MGRGGLRHRRSPPSTGRRMLHVEEETTRAAARRHLTLALLGDFTGLLALLAAHRKGERAETLLGDLIAALVAVAVAAMVEAGERVIDLVERLGFHLDERKLDLLLDVG